jgi:hypothetical protein
MAGYLDKNAESEQTEYISCLDGDYLGKVLFKNFLKNIIRLNETDFEIVIGKNGDTKFDSNFPGDATICTNGRKRVVEIKFARASFQGMERPTPNAGWTFSKVLQKDSGRHKKFDILFAVGITVPRLGSGYNQRQLMSIIGRSGRDSQYFSPYVYPHESDFLTSCGFFVIPQFAIETKGIDTTIRTVGVSRYGEYFAWGSDRCSCDRIWNRAMRSVNRRSI